MSLTNDFVRRTRFFDALFREFHEVSFAVRAADGWSWQSDLARDPQCVLLFRSAAAWNVFMDNPTQRTLGEAYIHGDLDVEGDLFAIFPVVRYVLRTAARPHDHALRAVWRASTDFARLLRHGPKHSASRDRAAIAYHYDLPVEFYRPWLGPTLVYSCAYFRDPAESLEIAQANKLELICRKLELQQNDRFLDIGCGWGSLVLHAASRYHTPASGITLSQAQAAIARQRIAHAQLDAICQIALRDYRDLPPSGARFNKVASVGMFEHVGRKRLRQYFDIVLQILEPDGLFLNHGIARSTAVPPAHDSFIDRYVFPDGELATLGEVLETAEAAGFEVRDVENLRSHYDRTLRLWVENLESNANAVRQHIPEQTYRIWRLYMAGSADAFQQGNIELYQVLLGSRPARKSFVEQRERWYQNWSTESSSATVW
jgi:cyclopropane-fatty-acyl-phospholipid synthase